MATRPPIASRGKRKPRGQRWKLVQSAGRNQKVMTVAIAVSPTMTPQNPSPVRRHRSLSSPVVLSAIQAAPCTLRAASDRSPIVTVYQSSTPGFGPIGLNVVQRAKKKCPCSSIGTPRTTLPKATPKKRARRELPTKNAPSQKSLQSGEGRCERSSIETPRMMRSQRTSIKGR
ncbi:hypothetical protein D3C86_470040 [compost metagenome]